MNRDSKGCLREKHNQSGPPAETGKKQRQLQGPVRIYAYVLGVSLAIITFYTAFRGGFMPIVQRSLHLCIITSLTFLWIPASKKSPVARPSVFDYMMSALSMMVLAWVLLNHNRYITRIPFYSEIGTVDYVCAAIMIFCALECGRRTLGPVITILASAFILYAFCGPAIPGILSHPAMKLSKFVDQVFMNTEGLFSSLMGMSATLLFIFISFGCFLQGTGADRYYMDICLAIAGRKPGGPAKVAALSSAAMGSISGSTISNVVTTGTLTIPLMKKTGYQPYEAGAIETAASSGGQVMPPIMGTGAFLMAEIIGVKYLSIVRIAFIPALLYYLSIWFSVDFIARKRGIKGLSREDTPELVSSLKKGGILFLPILILVVLLVMNFTPFLSGAVCVLLILLVSSIRRETRLSVKKIFDILEECSKNMISITSVIACASIIIAIINITGIMVKSTSIILHFSGGLLLPTVLLIALMSYLLGMGLPVSTCYIILSTLGATAMVEMGVKPICAHMMIFWFTQLATVTPPVCMTAFAAAGIAGAKPMQTGFAALKLSAGFYYIPILFLISNLLTGSAAEIAVLGVLSLAGVYLYVATTEGYLNGNLSRGERVITGMGAAFMFLSTAYKIILPVRISACLLGAVILVGIFIKQERCQRI